MKKHLLAAVCAFAALTSTHAQAQDAKLLRMACESTYAPFVFFDSETGKLKGFEIDLLEYVAKETGRKLEVTNMGFDAIIPSLLTGMHDLGASAFTITPERAKRVLFTKPYYISGLSILIRAEDKDSIKSVKDIENCTICAQIGTSGSMRAAKVPGAKVRNFNTINDAFLELNNKGCKAVITDRPVTSYFLAARPNSASEFYHLPTTLNTEKFGFTLRKNNVELQKAVDAAIDKARANGEFTKMYVKWFGEEPPKELLQTSK